MNIEDVKQIPIADYLHSLGYSPVGKSSVSCPLKPSDSAPLC